MVQEELQFEEFDTRCHLSILWRGGTIVIRLKANLGNRLSKREHDVLTAFALSLWCREFGGSSPLDGKVQYENRGIHTGFD